MFQLNLSTFLSVALLAWRTHSFLYFKDFHSPQRSSQKSARIVRPVRLAAESPDLVLSVNHDRGSQYSQYDWKKHWYAVAYTCNLPDKGEEKPMSYSIFDHELAIWRDQDGHVRCVEDKCTHRATRLSEGHVLNGNLECLYHGWTFNGTGVCIKIPQLDADTPIPAKACVRYYALAIKEDILWVWMDTPATADYNAVPSTPVDMDSRLFKDKYFRYDFQIDLPYDHSFLIENLLDPAHAAISHDRTPGGGMKENAQPLVMEVGRLTDQGFTGSYRATRLSYKKPNMLQRIGSKLFGNKTTVKEPRPFIPSPPVYVTYEAPGIVRQLSSGETGGVTPNSVIANQLQTFGAALHCMPMGYRRSRLLFTTFFKANPLVRFLFGLKPAWMRYLGSCKVLEQDVTIITSQEDILAKQPFLGDGSSGAGAISGLPADNYLTLKTSDALVMQYRKWLDRVGPAVQTHTQKQGISITGGGMPYYTGWRTQQQAAVRSGGSLSDPVFMLGPPSETVSASPDILTARTSDPTHRAHTSRYENHVIHHKPTLRVLRKIEGLCRVFEWYSCVGIVTSLFLVCSSLMTVNHATLYVASVASLISTLITTLISFAATKALRNLHGRFFKNFQRFPGPTGRVERNTQTSAVVI